MTQTISNEEQKETTKDFQNSVNLKTKKVSVSELSEQYIFREVTNDDLEELKQLDLTLFHEAYYKRYYTSLLNRSFYAQVVEDKKNNKIVGECTAEIKFSFSQKKKKAYIMTLGVLPEASHSGIGYNLLKNCVEYYKKQELFVQISLHVAKKNLRAVTFYQRYGFVIKKSISKYYSQGETGRAAYEMCYLFHKEDEKIEKEEITETKGLVKIFKGLKIFQKEKTNKIEK
ncbi:n-alpha-acetyltransferase 50 [Anaeramoeba flamelloides]|uniref:N-alpha-acetyltransferase 50 n=1 Tax=Anaeramoeba flamelloides TaxID=1746091 RepID=A0ABQ8YAX9_9EUKA|nr:n-alpha-acetyltransferase 50 [Anaeramoeba flamelloides]